MPPTTRDTLGYAQLRRAVEGVRLPAAIVDLDAFDENLEAHLTITRRAGLPLRLATKSIRVVSLLRRALGRPGTRGLMCYSPHEAERLHSLGFDDLFIAYPVFRPDDVRGLARLTREGANVSVAVDSEEAALVYSEIAERQGARLRVVLCVDMSLRLGGGRLHIGVRRSPVHDEHDVVALAEKIRARPALVLHGLMGYEAQVAGLPDKSPFDSQLVRFGKRTLRAASMRELGERRARMAVALRERGHELAFVNGGGTGSLDLTVAETGVTEVTAGSGLFKPLLFDGYESPFVSRLRPACFFALEVTRRPGPGMVTCFGGGYVASGSAGPEKLPRPVFPHGLDLSSTEGAGEVQTPVFGAAADALRLGDPVFFRHAKAGELMERFDEVVLVRGGRAVERVKTYRGDGWCFG